MDRLDEVLEEVRAFVREREWAQYHDPKNLAMAVASEAGELAAELRWVASDAADAFCEQPEARKRVADEIGDVAITVLMLADRIGLDLVECMKQKIVKNARKYPVEASRGKFDAP